MKVLNEKFYLYEKDDLDHRICKMRTLDPTELEDINGGLGTVAIGAIVGAGWNAYQYVGSGSPNGFGGFLMAAGSGAVGGAIAGMGGFGFGFYGGGMAAVGSMAAGGSW